MRIFFGVFAFGQNFFVHRLIVEWKFLSFSFSSCWLWEKRHDIYIKLFFSYFKAEKFYNQNFFHVVWFDLRKRKGCFANIFLDRKIFIRKISFPLSFLPISSIMMTHEKIFVFDGKKTIVSSLCVLVYVIISFKIRIWQNDSHFLETNIVPCHEKKS